MRVDHALRQRDIGPIGTASRIIAGTAALGVPIAVLGAAWWDLAIALVGFPLLSTAVAGAIARVAPARSGCRDGLWPARGCVLFAVMIGATVALSVTTPVQGDVVFWGWLGASMLLAAARGYGGCEALAFYNLLTGRRDQIGCLLFTPIDLAEARRAGGRTRSDPG